MDPVSIIGLVSATTGVIEVISRNISFLVELQSRYKSADLKVSLLIGQLSTLKAALEQIGDLMNTSIFDSPCHQPLIQDLRTALDCCEALILILDERSCALRRSEIYGLDFLGRVQFVRDEKGMAEYQNLLNNHINALTLLLTALQCRTQFEQSGLLQSKEIHHVFQLVKDDTSSLLWLRDAESCGTYRSVHNENLELIDMVFDFDREIFSSKVYRKATRSHMIQALIDGQSGEGKPVTPPLDRKIRNRFIKADEGDSDKQTIRERSIPSQFQVSTVKGSEITAAGSSPKVHQDLQAEMVCHPKPLASSPVSAGENIHGETIYRRAKLETFDRHLVFSLVTPHLALENSTTDMTKTVKVLIMGTIGSGKSTLMKSIGIHQGLYPADIRASYKLNIIQYILRSLQIACDATRPMELPEAKIYLGADQVKGYCNTLLKIEPAKLVLSPGIAAAVEALWNYPFVRALVYRLNDCYVNMDSTKYYFESISRIAQPDYIPTGEDIIRLYCRTTEIQDLKFTTNHTPYWVIEVSSTQNKGIYSFNTVEKIFFTVDMGAYDEALREDSSVNGMRESLELFDSVCKSRWFFNTSPLKEHFPDYDGDQTDMEQVKAYFHDQFLGCCRSFKHSVTIHFTSILDVKCIAEFALAAITEQPSP